MFEGLFRRYVVNSPVLPVLLVIFLAACRRDTGNSGVCACVSVENEDSTIMAFKTVRGALLGSRFSSLDELKSVIRIDYDEGAADSDSTAGENHSVCVRHCSGGREITSLLETGASQGDFEKAKESGKLLDQLSLLVRCPYAVINRKDLE